MVFYYSGCGNSRHIARRLSEQLGERLAFIPDLLREEPQSFDCRLERSIGFVMPVYAWAAPSLVEDFVKRTEWQHSEGTYIWAAFTCGDDMGLADRRFRSLLEKCSLHLDAVFCFVMPETYLCFPGFKLDSPQGAAQKIRNAQNHLSTVGDAIMMRKTIDDTVRGSAPRLKTKIIRPLFYAIMTDKGFYSTQDCDHCGLCEKLCPLKNISLQDGKPEWHSHCTQCMSCYHHCPKNAIQFRKLTLGKGQYYFGKSLHEDKD